MRAGLPFIARFLVFLGLIVMAAPAIAQERERPRPVSASPT